MKKRRSYFGWIPYYRGPFSNHWYSIKSLFVCDLRDPYLRQFGPIGWVKVRR